MPSRWSSTVSFAVLSGGGASIHSDPCSFLAHFLVAELAPLMAKRGKGAIVNLSTMVADYGAPGMSLYGSSKAAINLLTKVWAAEYGPSGVRINAVSPGPTRTEGTDAMLG
jgi:NAD(P)-dependent dehydrogenase (short-subunit alcohol dehydrogenase family)